MKVRIVGTVFVEGVESGSAAMEAVRELLPDIEVKGFAPPSDVDPGAMQVFFTQEVDAGGKEVDVKEFEEVGEEERAEE